MEEVHEELGRIEDTPENRLRVALDAFERILQSGELQNAKQFCEWILQHSPLNPIFNFHLGNIENQLGNYESAKKAFLLSDQYSRGNPRTLFNIGYVCFRLDEFQKAIDAYLKALEALRQEDERLRAVGAFSMDHLPVERVHQNLGIAQSCLACTYMETEPEKARQHFREALSTFNKVIELVDVEARSQSPVYGPAFVNKLQALQSLIELQDPEVEIIKRELDRLITHGLESSDLKDENRDIQAILWKQQQVAGIEMPLERILTEDITIKLNTAMAIESQLQAILNWHQIPVDWPALIAQHNESMRNFKENVQNRIRDAEDNTPTQKESHSSESNSEEKSPELKRHRWEGDQSSSELPVYQEVGEDPTQAVHRMIREKNKVDELVYELRIHMAAPGQFPFAFEIMLSSPEFLRLHGWYRFDMGRLPHVIHDSYIYFHLRALFYNERLSSGCSKQLELAGLKINQNNYMAAVEIITKAMGTMANACPNFVPRFICELNRPEDPEIQIKRRQDLITIARLYIHHFYYKAELLLGLACQLMNQDGRAVEAFDRCYTHIGALEDILKSPQHTETFRLIKDANKNLQFSALTKAARDCERKIPEKLRARIKCLEDFLQQDALRVSLENSSVPFPYDRFKEGFSEINKQLGIPDYANFSDHVLSVIYLMPDGSVQVSSMAFNAGGVAFDLYNMAKKYDVYYGAAKTPVVNKVNHGKHIFNGLEEAKKQSSSLAFMRHVELQNAFIDSEHKHSEQVYYFALDRHDLNDIISSWQQDSKGKFTPECTVVGVISNMKSLKTGCPRCKCSAIATQNPAQDDNSAFLNRLHAALVRGGYKVQATEPGKPKLSMVTRIRAFTKDQHAKTHGLHENPMERNIANQENLAIFEKLETSTCVSGYRQGIY